MKKITVQNIFKIVLLLLWILLPLGMIFAQAEHTHTEILDSAGIVVSSTEGVCFRYNPFLAWNLGISDLIIFLCYIFIPLGMFQSLKALPTGLAKPLRNYSILLGFFIITCGLTHFMKVFLFFNASWNLAIMINWLCAIASTVAALYLWIYARTTLKNIAVNLKDLLLVKDSLKKLDELEKLISYESSYDQLTVVSIKSRIELIRMNLNTLQSFQDSIEKSDG